MAGTGEYEAEVGKHVVNPNIFESVMEKNDTLIINRPGEDPVCAGCANKASCREKAAVYAPLHVKGEIRGAMALIAFTEEQKNSGLFAKDVFVNFTKKLSELISSKIEAAEYADQLLSLIHI